MAYEPTVWQCGDAITADALNKMERGIQENMSDYVPTNWQCGDTITAEALNKMEQAIANCSGGSSDFSVATVTVINNSSYDTICGAATIIELPAPVPSSTTAGFSISANTTTIGNVILYKGNGDISFEPSGVLNGTGNVEIDGSLAYITGDCTITISERIAES